MTRRVTRATSAGRIYLDLQKLARGTGRNTDDLLRSYVFESFLRRLASSVRRDELVLKGGMLLAALGVRRPTMDIDMLARQVANDTATVEVLVAVILEVDVGDDGVSFEADKMESRVIREGDVYSGVLRVEVPAGLATARVKLKLDINFGDPVSPGPALQAFPTLLEESTDFEVLCYPLETVLAEKLETMIRRGDANTRWRDFADVVVLSRNHSVEADELETASRATCSHRGTPWMPINDAIETLPAAAQQQWETFRKQRRLDDLPETFGDIAEEVTKFADPVFTGLAAGRTWTPGSGWE